MENRPVLLEDISKEFIHKLHNDYPGKIELQKRGQEPIPGTWYGKDYVRIIR